MVLTAVEILSRYAFTIPVYRKDTKNMTKALNLLPDNFKSRFGKYPNVTQFDEKKEFYNGVKDLLKSHNVNYFSTHSDIKAAIVERFNWTLKTMMWKYFYSKGTYNWIDVLDKFSKNYNNTKHRSILMKPKDVNKTNENMVWITLYGSPMGELPYRYLNLELGILLGLANTKEFLQKDTRQILQRKYLKYQKYSGETLIFTK